MQQSIGTIEIPAHSLGKQFTVNVKLIGLKSWRIRLKIGLLIIRFGSWIIGSPLEVEE